MTFITPKLESSIATGPRHLTTRFTKPARPLSSIDMSPPLGQMVAVDSPVAARSAYLKEREKWMRARRAEQSYGTQLRQVAHQIGIIIKGFAPTGTLEQFYTLRDTLYKYADLLFPWAKAVSQRMIEEVSRRDADAWIEHGNKMGRSLWNEITLAPTGQVLRQRLDEQVDLITSLPREAAERVHTLTLRAATTGTRAESIAKEILNTDLVTRSRANLIARTEVTRTASELLRARAQFVGSTHYVWRTAMDADVRPLHRALEGKAFEWDDPPVTGSAGERSLPGGIYNCRCYAEPVIPDL